MLRLLVASAVVALSTAAKEPDVGAGAIDASDLVSDGANCLAMRATREAEEDMLRWLCHVYFFKGFNRLQIQHSDKRRGTCTSLYWGIIYIKHYLYSCT